MKKFTCLATCGVSLLFFQLFTVSGSANGAKECQCHEPKNGDTTRWGGNMTVELLSKSAYRTLEGKVTAPDGALLPNALVEVFAISPNSPDESPSRTNSTPEQHRLTACVTAADGKFCFRNLPTGKYELRSSINTGWNVTIMKVVVDAKSGKKTAIAMRMQLGT